MEILTLSLLMLIQLISLNTRTGANKEMSELNYRLNFIPALEVSSDSITVCSSSLEQSRQELNIIANYTLFLHDNGMMNDYSNCGWIEELVDGEWEEVDEEEDK